VCPVPADLISRTVEWIIHLDNHGNQWSETAGESSTPKELGEAMNGATGNNDSHAVSVPLVFISHKHVDRQIAGVLADFINEESRGEVDVHNSSNSSYLGPATGERLTDALREVLWRTDVLLLIYTSADQDWSFCMWEAGVATDSQSPDTRTVVLQCGDDVPPPFQGFVRVDLRNKEDVRKFVSEFFLDANYFPRRGRGLTPRWKRDSVLKAADGLHAALSAVIQPVASTFSYLWPSLQLRVDGTISDPVRANPVDRAACRAAVSQGARVSEWFQAAPDLFGVQDIKGATLGELRDRWSQATGSPDTAWHESCCDQIVDVILGVAPVVRQEELQRPGADTTLTPALTRWRRGVDDTDFEFEFIDMSNPRGIPVEARMLSVDRIQAKTVADAPKVKLVTLSADMMSQRINRLPVLDAESRIKFVVHKSVIDGFIVALITSGRLNDTVTLDDLLREPAHENLISAVVFVPPETSMADARLTMVAKKNCQDVFITPGGRPDEPILGWLTNTDFRRTKA
jgi:CBS domain-containing protein